MRPHDVEQWLADVLGHLERGLRVEDDRVECKRQFPSDHARAARRLAGHANQAREDRILWVIGVDEAGSEPVVGRAPNEPDTAAWWTQIEARFDDVAPSPTWVNVTRDRNRSVLGIAFDTSRPPYVVRLSSDNPSREVPWRAGTRVRSANRYDLLKLLAPIAERPTVTVLGGYIDVNGSPSRGGGLWRGRVELYVDCWSMVVLPDHRCSGSIHFDSGHEIELVVSPSAIDTGLGPTRLAEQRDGQVVVTGPTPIGVNVHHIAGPHAYKGLPNNAFLRLELHTGGPHSAAVHVAAHLDRGPHPRSDVGLARYAVRAIDRGSL